MGSHLVRFERAEEVALEALEDDLAGGAGLLRALDVVLVGGLVLAIVVLVDWAQGRLGE